MDLLTKFMVDVAAVVVGVALLALGFAYFTASPTVKGYCDVITHNPVDQTSCIVQTTLKY